MDEESRLIVDVPPEVEDVGALVGAHAHVVDRLERRVPFGVIDAHVAGGGERVRWPGSREPALRQRILDLVDRVPHLRDFWQPDNQPHPLVDVEGAGAGSNVLDLETRDLALN